MENEKKETPGAAAEQGAVIKTVQVTPNPRAIRVPFERDLMNSLETFARRMRRAPSESEVEISVIDLYSPLHSLSVILECLTTLEDLKAFREAYGDQVSRLHDALMQLRTRSDEADDEDAPPPPDVDEAEVEILRANGFELVHSSSGYLDFERTYQRDERALVERVTFDQTGGGWHGNWYASWRLITHPSGDDLKHATSEKHWAPAVKAVEWLDLQRIETEAELY